MSPKCLRPCVHLCVHSWLQQSIKALTLRSLIFHLGIKEATYLFSIKKSMLGEHSGAVRSDVARERKDLTSLCFPANNINLEICLRSLVIVDSVLEATVLWRVTKNRGACTCTLKQKKKHCFLHFYTRGLTCSLGCAGFSAPSLGACSFQERACLWCVLLWMMALLKCCKEKHWFATSLIHCWFERNLHSRQTRGRSGLSLAGWLDASSLSSRRSLGPAAVLLFMQNKPPKKQIRIETLGASSVWCCLILAHSLTRSWFHLSACYSLHTGTPHFLPFLLLFSLSLLDRLAAVLSGTVLVTEDMLTSGDRYRLPNRSICSGAVRERVHRHLDTSSGVWAKCLALRTDTHRRCCRSFHCALEGVSSRCTGMWVHSVHVLDLDISLWGIIWTASTAIFLYEYFTII